MRSFESLYVYRPLKVYSLTINTRAMFVIIASQLDIIEHINPTQYCDKNQVLSIEVFKWKEYLEIQLNNSVYGNCEMRKKPYYDGFICVQTDANECDC